jgi:hypothetical protein
MVHHKSFRKFIPAQGLQNATLQKKITEDLVDMMMAWRHSGFNVYCGPRIQPGEEEAIDSLARYLNCIQFSEIGIH